MDPDHVVQVLSILRRRNALDDWEVESIDGLPEEKVAEKLAGCGIFLSFGTFEGCPLPPLEAMASGCVVIGYHGRGGREYFDPSFSHPIEAGDVIGFAEAVATAIGSERHSQGALEAQGKLAAARVRQYFSPEIEEQDIQGAWQLIGRNSGSISNGDRSILGGRPVLPV